MLKYNFSDFDAFSFCNFVCQCLNTNKRSNKKDRVFLSQPRCDKKFATDSHIALQSWETMLSVLILKLVLQISGPFPALMIEPSPGIELREISSLSFYLVTAGSVSVLKTLNSDKFLSMKFHCDVIVASWSPYGQALDIRLRLVCCSAKYQFLLSATSA